MKPVLEQLVELIPDAVVIVGRDSTIRLVNAEAEQMFGFDQGELTGQPVGALLPLGARASHPGQLRAFFEESRARKMGLGKVLRAKRKDGSEFPVEVALTPLPSADDPLVVAVVRDVSQRVRSLEDLRASEEQQRLVLETAPDVTAVIDSKAVIEFSSRAFHGREPSALTGSSLANLVDQESQPILKDALERAASSDQLVTFEVVAPDGDGGPLRLCCRMRRLQQGPSERFLVVLADVTLAREVDAEVSRLRDAMENVVEGISMVDRAGRIIAVNAACAGMLGGDAAELVGREWVQTFAAGARDTVAGAVATLAARGRADFDGTAVRADATTFPVRVTLVRAQDASRKDEGHFCFMRDVTEQHKTREQLLISDRMASVGMLAAGVAHEINNPLAAVIANLELIAAELPPLLSKQGYSGELEQMIGEARESADRVRVIVRDLRVFCRHETDKLEAVDLEAVIESALKIARNEIRHRAKLVRRFGGVPRVAASECRLAQVILNLVVNAAQAIPEGHADAEEIRVVTRVDETGRAVFEVHDTGPGIPADVLPKLFVPFFTTKPVGVGTGLGLSICHRIVTGFGGEIRVDSTVGKGTTVSVAIPLAPASAPAPSVPEREAPVATRRGRVLVIDDEPTICSFFQRILAPAHDVVTAVQADRALELIAAGQRFDVIFCDMMMPQMTGEELHARLLALSGDQAEKIVFVTGGAFTADAQAFLARVPNLRLEKPISLALVRSTVNARVG